MRAACAIAIVFAQACAAATFDVPAGHSPGPLVFVAYGDMRFTDAGEINATNPVARQALIARIAADNPAAIFINGDLPWHGVAEDYAVYRRETRRWRDRHLHVYPALGNHELAGCAEPACLERWWSVFPELRGRRWYSVALGNRVVGIVLDSDVSLLPDSEQRRWLEQEIAAFNPDVRVALIILHHPPLADEQSGNFADHNPRPNEQALGAYLEGTAPRMHVRFVVSAGHIHNYERLQRAGVVYLVSGGGGARPYEVVRTAADAYQASDFPNYHYVRFELRGQILTAEMIRWSGPAATGAAAWEIRDRFEFNLPP